MSISYEPLMNTMAEKNMTKSELRVAAGLSKGTFAKLSKGESVTLSTIESICMVLDVPIEEVVSIVPDSAGNGSDEGR